VEEGKGGAEGEKSGGGNECAVGWVTQELKDREDIWLWIEGGCACGFQEETTPTTSISRGEAWGLSSCGATLWGTTIPWRGGGFMNLVVGHGAVVKV